MRQYELAIRIAQVHHLVDERKYKKALAVIQTLDMRQVRSMSDLKVFAEVYTKTEQYEAAKATYLRIYRRSRTRRVLYRLIYLSIRTNALEDAEAYYREFVQMNPNGRDALILRYRIDKAAGVPIGRLIEILQALKQEEYIEEWAYELAKLYYRAGRKQECLEECQDILLWFGMGEIVERAKILIDHLQERDPVPYYDDKDFTVPRKEEPNPEDTGSLPDLNEFIKERKGKKKEARRQDAFEDDYREDDIVSIMKDEEPEAEATKPGAKESGVAARKEKSDDTFIDDYEEDDFEDVDISQKAKDGIQKLSGLLKLGKREEDKEKDDSGTEESWTAEESKKEEEPVQQRAKPANTKKEKEAMPKYVPHSQSGTGITQDLAKEISAIYEMEHREQLKEKAVTVINEVPNIATNVVDRMTQAIQKSSGRGYIPIDIEEIHGDSKEAARKAEEREKARKAAEEKKRREEEEKARKEAEEEEAKRREEEEHAHAEAEEEEAKRREEEEHARAEAEKEEAKRREEEERARIEAREAEEETAEEPPKDALMEALDAEVEEYYENLRKTEAQEEETEAAVDENGAVGEEEEETAMENLDAEPEEEQKSEAEILKDLLEEEIQDPEKEETAASEHVSPLENYHAPEIPIVETEYMEIPEISFEDLPTTRALQQSFQNVLQLIAGELDPSHFVLMGDGGDRIVGVSKHIVRIMKETGYLSQGRIAKINAVQLNKMDLITFRNQLKGNCLLIESAADLLFPTITKIFSIMEEYYGDFVVILADEGTTLDQLFRFVPVLAKKFKYIIDISKYTEKDYQ